MTAKTRFRLLVWPPVTALAGGVWWGLTLTGVPWWAVPVGVLALFGFMTIVGFWIGAVEKAAKDRRAEKAADWDGAVKQLLTEEERAQGWRDPRSSDGNA